MTVSTAGDFDAWISTAAAVDEVPCALAEIAPSAVDGPDGALTLDVVSGLTSSSCVADTIVGKVLCCSGVDDPSGASAVGVLPA